MPVIHPQHHHASRAWQHLLGIGAPRFIPLQPRHVAGASLGQPGAEFRGVRRGRAVGNAADVESELLSERDELLFHVADYHEKAWRAFAITDSAAASCPSWVESRVNCAAPS